MGLALLFPGQGTQHAHAIGWLEHEPEAADILQSMAAVLGPDWRQRLADPAWATGNTVAQPLLTGLCGAAWACLAGRLPAPSVVAGYSVGELAAFAAAGVFDAATAMSLAVQRAAAMERSAAGRRTGLLAVQGVAPQRLNAWMEDHGLSLAIRLSADHAIVGGLEESLHAAEAELAATGTRCTRLAVQIASHTPWMAAAAAAFADILSTTTLAAPRVPVVCNLSGAASRQTKVLASCLAGQIARPVLWDHCMDSVMERGVRCVLEVGPGSTLASTWRTRWPDMPVRSVDEFRSPDAVSAWVERTLASR